MKLAVGKCWVDPGLTPNLSGYVQKKVNKKDYYVHRLSWEYFFGNIPINLEIDHVCKNKACYRFSHLELVTRQENCRRSVNYRGGFCRKCGELMTHKVKATGCIDGFAMRCRECYRLYAIEYKKTLLGESL